MVMSALFWFTIESSVSGDRRLSCVPVIWWWLDWWDAYGRELRMMISQSPAFGRILNMVVVHRGPWFSKIYTGRFVRRAMFRRAWFSLQTIPQKRPKMALSSRPLYGCFQCFPQHGCGEFAPATSWWVTHIPTVTGLFLESELHWLERATWVSQRWWTLSNEVWRVTLSSQIIFQPNLTLRPIEQSWEWMYIISGMYMTWKFSGRLVLFEVKHLNQPFAIFSWLAGLQVASSAGGNSFLAKDSLDLLPKHSKFPWFEVPFWWCLEQAEARALPGSDRGG